MKKKILALGMVLALVAVLAVPMAVMADNTGEQEAFTAQATAINIVDKTGDTAITTITFPEDVPSAVISDPYSDVDSGDPQFLDGSASEPVVRLLNTSGGTLTVSLAITSWTEAVVAEDYELVTEATVTVDVVDDVLSANGGAATVDTGTTIAASAYLALYLEVTLSALYGKSGTSTLTILGET